MTPIRLLDTTLRDGELAPAFNPAADERMAIAAALDAAGVGVIELASTGDDDARLAQSKEIAVCLERATVCCLAPLTEGDLLRAGEFLDGIGKSRLHLYLDAHRIRALETDAGLEREIFSAIKALVGEASGFTEVEFSPQDATRIPPQTLVKIVAAGVDAGAGIINISDTTGTATPAEIADLFATLRASVPGLDSTMLSLHAHDHRGRAVENARAAVAAGAVQIEVTIGGVGPAGGNTDLLEVLRSVTDGGSPGGGFAGIDLDRLEALASMDVFQRRED
jgi:2-isopropylmalate synthase